MGTQSKIMNFTLFVLLFVCVLLVNADSHSHSHDHSHDHHAHSHTHDSTDDVVEIDPNEESPEDIGKWASHDCGSDHGHGHGHGHGHAHAHSDDHEEIHGESSFQLQTWLKAIGATILISMAPLIMLGFIPLESASEESPLLRVLLAFAAGGLLGDVFLHLLPHTMAASGGDHSGHSHAHDHNSDDSGHSHSLADLSVGMWILAGITIFLVIEKFVRAVHGGESGGHSHSHSHAHVDKTAKKKKNDDESEVVEQQVDKSMKVHGWLNLAADFAHNFTDGLAIGATFHAGQRLGTITTVAILLHEVPHEIGDFAILLQCGLTKRQAMWAQASTAIGALMGTVVGLLADNVSSATAWVLPLTAGGFIYIALVSVFPSLLQPASAMQSLYEILALGAGIGLMTIIALIE